MSKSKRILISGITGNLGKASKTIFEAEGWEVVGLSRSTGLDLRNLGGVLTFLSHQMPFDIIFVTHGVQVPVKLEELDATLWHQVIDNNLTSAVILTHCLKRLIMIAPGGLIVYCSSIQATQPREGRGLYAIAKAGLEALARIAAVEFAPEVRVIALRLGQMDGQMQGIEFSQAAVDAISEHIPLPWVSFEETARLVLALYEQKSLTGEVIEISSGHKFSVWPK